LRVQRQIGQSLLRRSDVVGLRLGRRVEQQHAEDSDREQ